MIVFSHLSKLSLIWVFDMKGIKRKAITVGAIFGVDIVCLVLFGVILGWI